MKYLITGVNGQLGHDLFKILDDERNSLLAPSSKEMNLLDEKRIHEVIEGFKPDVIIHAAAYTAVDNADKSIEEADKCFLVNKVGTDAIVNAARKVNAKVIYVSTDYVFDGEKSAPYKVDDKVNPVNWYGKTKLLGEESVLAYEKGMVVRTQWVFGINGKNFIKTMLKLANTKDELNVVCDQFGAPTYTVDLAKKLVLLSESFDRGIYHASNTGDMSWYDFAKMIFEMNGIDIPVNRVKTLEYKTIAVRPLNTTLDKSKLINDVGIMEDASDALDRYMGELKNDEEMKLVLKENSKRWKR